MNDTNPRAARVRIDLFRKAGVARRFEPARSLSLWAVQLARRGIRDVMPDATEDLVSLKFVEVHYGQDPAHRLRAYLAAR